ncbi:hypothetical protein, partial [Bacillus licheniformis]|uniref:hypothetical protein n=1 Tax=Bacillus licheniformis TaxID=1402 RepID=UPI001639F33A
DLKPGNYYVTVKEESVNKQFKLENDLQHVLVEKDKTTKAVMNWVRVGGSLMIESKDTDDVDVDGVEYEVKNSDGKVQTDWNALKFGTYTVTVKNYPKENYQLQGDSEQTVEISEANPKAKAKF